MHRLRGSRAFGGPGATGEDEQYDDKGTTYADGVGTATFECQFPASFNIGGDDFRTQFNLQMPVDDFGLPEAFLAPDSRSSPRRASN